MRYLKMIVFLLFALGLMTARQDTQATKPIGQGNVKQSDGKVHNQVAGQVERENRAGSTTVFDLGSLPTPPSPSHLDKDNGNERDKEKKSDHRQ